MQVIVASTPRRLRITDTMIEDFLVDPVLGAKVMMGVDLDVFQRQRLRAYHWYSEVIDSSGLSTAKSFVFWVFVQVRCLLFGDQVCGFYSQTFESGKQNFWSYYPAFERRESARIWRAQIGEFEAEGDDSGKPGSRGASCYIYRYKNGSEVKMPAPGWVKDARTQAGLNFNVLGIDEWTKIEADGTEGIDDQLLGRVRRANYNQHHPIWGNKQIFLAAAENRRHPAYRRVRNLERRIARGDPTCAHVSWNFKDYSDKRTPGGKTFKEVYRDEKMFNRIRANFTLSHFMEEALGVWSQHGDTWYPVDDIQRCIEMGKRVGTEVVGGRGDG